MYIYIPIVIKPEDLNGSQLIHIKPRGEESDGNIISFLNLISLLAQKTSAKFRPILHSI